MIPVIYLVVPCYNEEAVLPKTSKVLYEKINAFISRGDTSPDSRIYFVDDGSSDSTWQIIENLHVENKIFCGIKLAHNKGHQNALLAGLLSLREKCDAIISMDADLQDDVNAIDEMILRFREGVDIVYGVRSSRKKDSFSNALPQKVFIKSQAFFPTRKAA